MSRTTPAVNNRISRERRLRQKQISYWIDLDLYSALKEMQKRGNHESFSGLITSVLREIVEDEKDSEE